MTIYSKPENALVAYDRLLDFEAKVGFMYPDEVDLLRQRVHVAGLSKKVLACALALIDAIEKDE